MPVKQTMGPHLPHWLACLTPAVLPGTPAPVLAAVAAAVAAAPAAAACAGLPWCRGEKRMTKMQVFLSRQMQAHLIFLPKCQYQAHSAIQRPLVGRYKQREQKCTIEAWWRERHGGGE